MSTEWFHEWFDTVKGKFEGYEDVLRQSLITLGFTTELSLSKLEMRDLDSSILLLGQKKALLFVAATFKEKFEGMSIAASNLLFCPPQNLTRIHRLSPFPFQSLHHFRLPFSHHSISSRRSRYVCGDDIPISFLFTFR